MMYPIKRKAAMERMVMVIRVRESFFGEASIGLEEEEVEAEEGEEEAGDMVLLGHSYLAKAQRLLGRVHTKFKECESVA